MYWIEGSVVSLMCWLFNFIDVVVFVFWCLEDGCLCFFWDVGGELVNFS